MDDFFSAAPPASNPRAPTTSNNLTSVNPPNPLFTSAAAVHPSSLAPSNNETLDPNQEDGQGEVEGGADGAEDELRKFEEAISRRFGENSPGTLLTTRLLGVDPGHSPLSPSSTGALGTSPLATAPEGDGRASSGSQPAMTSGGVFSPAAIALPATPATPARGRDAAGHVRTPSFGLNLPTGGGRFGGSKLNPSTAAMRALSSAGGRSGAGVGTTATPAPVIGAGLGFVHSPRLAAITGSPSTGIPSTPGVGGAPMSLGIAGMIPKTPMPVPHDGVLASRSQSDSPFFPQSQPPQPSPSAAFTLTLPAARTPKTQSQPQPPSQVQTESQAQAQMPPPTTITPPMSTSPPKTSRTPSGPLSQLSLRSPPSTKHVSQPHPHSIKGGVGGVVVGAGGVAKGEAAARFVGYVPADLASVIRDRLADTEPSTSSPSPPSLSSSSSFSTSSSLLPSPFPHPSQSSSPTSPSPSHSNSTKNLVIDIRNHAHFLDARIAGAISLSVPSTLLKRPAFSLTRLAEMIPLPAHRRAFLAWNSGSGKAPERIIVYDADTSVLSTPGNNVLGLLNKFYNEGYRGELAFVVGGFGAVSRAFPPATSDANVVDTKEVGRGGGTPSEEKELAQVEQAMQDAQSMKTNEQKPRGGGRPEGRMTLGLGPEMGSGMGLGMGMGGAGLGGSSLPSGAFQRTSTGGNSSAKTHRIQTAQVAVANPFYDNIRQNLELSTGITERIPLVVPAHIVARESELPFQWLRDIVHKASMRSEDGVIGGEALEDLAMQFYRIELGEQRRLNGVMAHHSKESDTSIAATSRKKGKKPVGNAAKDNAMEVERMSSSPEEKAAMFPYSITAGVEKGAKNRYRNIWPFEHARVRLQHPTDKTDDGTGYINASYVQPRGTQLKYIATQGPLAATFDDFWTLVWEQNVAIIVMLTQQIEGHSIKCHCYWKREAFGPLRLKCTDVQGPVHLERDILGEESDGLGGGGVGQGANITGFDFAVPTPVTAVDGSAPGPTSPDGDFSTHGARSKGSTVRSSSTKSPDNNIIRRTFLLSHSSYPTLPPRKIVQLQFLGWPDLNVPSSANSLLNLIHELDELRSEFRSMGSSRSTNPTASEMQPGPVLVHCSAGVGRTGSFVIVDAVLDAIRRETRAKMDNGQLRREGGLIGAAPFENLARRVDTAQTEGAGGHESEGSGSTAAPPAASETAPSAKFPPPLVPNSFDSAPRFASQPFLPPLGKNIDDTSAFLGPDYRPGVIKLDSYGNEVLDDSDKRSVKKRKSSLADSSAIGSGSASGSGGSRSRGGSTDGVPEPDVIPPVPPIPSVHLSPTTPASAVASPAGSISLSSLQARSSALAFPTQRFELDSRKLQQNIKVGPRRDPLASPTSGSTGSGLQTLNPSLESLAEDSDMAVQGEVGGSDGTSHVSGLSLSGSGTGSRAGTGGSSDSRGSLSTAPPLSSSSSLPRLGLSPAIGVTGSPAPMTPTDGTQSSSIETKSASGYSTGAKQRSLPGASAPSTSHSLPHPSTSAPASIPLTLPDFAKKKLAGYSPSLGATAGTSTGASRERLGGGSSVAGSAAAPWSTNLKQGMNMTQENSSPAVASSSSVNLPVPKDLPPPWTSGIASSPQRSLAGGAYNASTSSFPSTEHHTRFSSPGPEVQMSETSLGEGSSNIQRQHSKYSHSHSPSHHYLHAHTHGHHHADPKAAYDYAPPRRIWLSREVKRKVKAAEHRAGASANRAAQLADARNHGVALSSPLARSVTASGGRMSIDSSPVNSDGEDGNNDEDEDEERDPSSEENPPSSPELLNAIDEPIRQVLEDMREQRMSLCQTLRQYVFVHLAVLEGSLQIVEELRAEKAMGGVKREQMASAAAHARGHTRQDSTSSRSASMVIDEPGLQFSTLDDTNSPPPSSFPTKRPSVKRKKRSNDESESPRFERMMID